MTKKQIKEKLEHFLHYELDKKYKGKNETHRWLFCIDPPTPNNPRIDINEWYNDCACCIADFSIDCGCICHERVNQLVNFIYKYVR